MSNDLAMAESITQQSPVTKWRRLSPFRLVKRMYDWVLHWAETRYAIPALVVLSFAESSFFPIPPDVLLIALAIGMPKKSLLFALYCSLASVIGGAFGYAIGMYGWAATSDIFFSYIPGFTTSKFALVQGYYKEWGELAVFVAGLTPIPYKVFTVASGVFQLNFPAFMGASLLSRSVRFFAVAGLIMLFGPRIKIFIERYFNILAVVFTLLLAGGFLLIKYVV